MKLKKFTVGRITVILLFAVILITGLCVFRDYGVSTDEPMQRNTLLINVQYILRRLGRSVSWNLPDLQDYVNRYYGIFLQGPVVLAELNAGTGGDYKVYLFRHLYTFLFCFSGYIAFYQMLMRLVHSRRLAITGVLMLAFYPRFFAEQFYNIKDLVFTAAWCWCLLASILAVQSGFRMKYLLLFAVVTAMASNCRFMAMIFPALMLLWFLYDRLKSEQGIAGSPWRRLLHNVLLPVVITFFTFLCTYIAITPILWEHPFRDLPAVIACFSDYGEWHGPIHFMGRVIMDNNIPWYYIPLWILISVPLWYLFLVLAEGIFFLRSMYGSAKKGFRGVNRCITGNPFALYVNAASFLPWIATVVIHSTIYNAWRHFYFVMPCLILDALLGIRHLEESGRMPRAAVRIAAVLGLSLQLMWIVRYHPFEMTYFNGAGRLAAENFDRDYWHMSSDALVSEIIRRENGKMSGWSVTAPSDFYKFHYPAGSFGDVRFVQNTMPELRWDELDTDYVIVDFRYSNGGKADVPGYKEVYPIRVDGYKIASLLEKD